MRELWLARNTLIEMISDRGYNTSNAILNYASFISLYPNAQSNPSVLNFIASKDNNSLAIHFTSEEKLAKKNLEMLSNEYSAQGVETVVLVTFNKLNPACKALLKSIKLMVEHFLIEELQFNITKHVLVPKHRIMSQAEVDKLLIDIKCQKSNLPTILTTDPVARYFGAKVDEVIEITRPSQTAGISIYYRAVREPGLK